MRPLAVLLSVASFVAVLPSQSVIQRWYGTTTSKQFGAIVRFAGDVDADGHADVIVIANGFAPARLEVFSGRTGASLLAVVEGVDVYSLPSWMERLGDVNGDGHDDLYVGNASTVVNGVRTFSLPIRSGRDGSTLFAIEDPALAFSPTLFGVGDVDADGRDDVGSVAGNDVRVYSGRDGAVIRTIPSPGAVRVGRAGDVDADGFADIRVDRPDFAVLVYSGRDSSQLRNLTGGLFLDGFARSVDAAGDVNGDGFDDVVVGLPTQTNGAGFRAGSVMVFSGADGSVLHSLQGDVGQAGFGSDVSGAGDVDGDGHADFLVSRPTDDNAGGIDAGLVRLYSGADGSVLRSFFGEGSSDHLGHSADGGFDLDGDGRADVAAGAIWDDDGATDAGSVLVFEAGFKGTFAHVRAFGAGCEGSNAGLPRIDIDGRPSIGAPVRLALTAALPQTPVHLLLGLRTDAALAVIGMPGCTQYASPITVVPAIADADGFATTGDLLVPNDAAFVGAEATSQWVCLDAGANALGLTASDGLQLVFGN